MRNVSQAKFTHQIKSFYLLIWVDVYMTDPLWESFDMGCTLIRMPFKFNKLLIA